MTGKVFATLAIAGVAGLCLLFVSPNYNYKQASGSFAGKVATDFTFQLNGKQSLLADLRGKVVVLNFWATWCQSCIDEMSSLAALQRKIVPEGGTVIGVSVDQDQQAYFNFIQTYGIDFPTLRDPRAVIAQGYGTYMYPETYIIDRHGRIARKIIGEQDWTSPQMMAYLDSILRTD